MNIVHYALYIKKQEYADRFFTGLLGLESQAEFAMDEAFSEKVFNEKGIRKGIIYKASDGQVLEVFTGDAEISPHIVNHVCLTVKDREALAEKAHKMGFDVNRIKRESKPDIIFIKDDLGNGYEIKEG